MIPAWHTVVVHQADTAEAFRRGTELMRTLGLSLKQAYDEAYRTCEVPANQATAFCVEHRPVTLAELQHLMTLVVQARR